MLKICLKYLKVLLQMENIGYIIGAVVFSLGCHKKQRYSNPTRLRMTLALTN